MIYHENNKHKKAGVRILLSDKVNLDARSVNKVKKRYNNKKIDS